MDHRRVISTLNLISKTYKRILDPSASFVIPGAIASVKQSKEAYDFAKRNASRNVDLEPWGYTIEDHSPLRFITSPVKDLQLQADVYCDIRWMEDDIPVKQEIKIRVWSHHTPVIFDPRRDSSDIEQELSDPTRKWSGRVISRFHFDKANDGQQGPMYHLQVGGNSKNYELCWHPASVSVPRFEYHPMELFLSCQMIAANFFWDEYLEIRQKSEWIQTLLMYQKALWLDHYQRCYAALQEDKPLLDALWLN